MQMNTICLLRTRSHQWKTDEKKLRIHPKLCRVSIEQRSMGVMWQMWQLCIGRNGPHSKFIEVTIHLEVWYSLDNNST